MAAKKHDPIPPLEWIAAAFGLLIAIGLVLIIAREGLIAAEDPVPRLTVEAGRLSAAPHGHVVEIRVRNLGPRTAASVQVEGKLDTETSSATIDYVPGHSEASGGLLFTGDPAKGQLDLRIIGYENP